jgi:hypothetical protein
MKKLLLLLFTAVAIISSCKEKESDRFIFLTGTVWTPVSLMADGVDASETLLVNFKGDARFNKDGTGTFGTYTGTWYFNDSETQIVLSTETLVIPITANIVELTKTSLKLQMLIPNPENLTGPPINIEMTFTAK